MSDWPEAPTWVQVPVQGWQTEWVRNLGNAKVFEIYQHEQVKPRPQDAEMEAVIVAGLIRRLRQQIAELAEDQGWVILAVSTVHHWWTDHVLQVHADVLKFDRAPVPPEQDWRWLR